MFELLNRCLNNNKLLSLNDEIIMFELLVFEQCQTVILNVKNKQMFALVQQ